VSHHIAIASYEKPSAENGLTAPCSLELDSQLTQDELNLIQEKVRKF
jgi:hypothetical protein